MPRIEQLEITPFEARLSEPFGIATGAQAVAANALVRLRLSDGTTGLGEAAPFPAVNGETQADVLAVAERARELVVGDAAESWRRIGRELGAALPSTPSAVAAIEMALLDALCRHHRLSLWAFFGGAERELETDITIVTGDVEHARSSATRAIAGGFSTLKIKIGKDSLEQDAMRVRAIAELEPRAALVLDANASLTANEALALLNALGEARQRVVLFEQPTAAGDLEGAARIRRDARVRIAADESARSAKDVPALARAGAADVINLKLTKCGIVDTLDMAAAARASGLGLMIGGMVETRLAMSVSACLAAGQGGFEHVDLDTPLFLLDDPFRGGFVQQGPRLSVAGIELGHGVELP